MRPRLHWEVMKLVDLWCSSCVTCAVGGLIRCACMDRFLPSLIIAWYCTILLTSQSSQDRYLISLLTETMHFAILGSSLFPVLWRYGLTVLQTRCTNCKWRLWRRRWLGYIDFLLCRIPAKYFVIDLIILSRTLLITTLLGDLISLCETVI